MKPKTPEQAKAEHTLRRFAFNWGSKAVKRRHAMEAARIVLDRLERFEMEERKRKKDIVGTIPAGYREHVTFSAESAISYSESFQPVEGKTSNILTVNSGDLDDSEVKFYLRGTLLGFIKGHGTVELNVPHEEDIGKIVTVVERPNASEITLKGWPPK